MVGIGQSARQVDYLNLKGRIELLTSCHSAWSWALGGSFVSIGFGCIVMPGLKTFSGGVDSRKFCTKLHRRCRENLQLGRSATFLNCCSFRKMAG